MNKCQELLFHSQGITQENIEQIDLSSLNKVINKPYTSAPKMADTVDYEDLIEIPLSTSTMKSLENEIHIEVDKNCDYPEFMAPKNCSLNVSPSDQISGSILAVDELLKCSTDISNSKLTMPYVEDGLSSESDVNSPKVSPIHSYNANITSNESLFNSTLMTAISKDIDDLRKAINGNRAILNDPRAGLSFMSLSKPSLDTLNLSHENNEHKSSVTHIKPNTHNVFHAASSTKGPLSDQKELSFDLCKNKEITKDSNKFSNKDIQAPDQCLKNLEKFNPNRITNNFEQLEAQHWTFPTASHTVYSSSSSDEHDTDCEIKRDNVNYMKHNEIEKSKIVATLNFSNAFQQSISNLERFKIKSNGDYESDEDTDKLLLKQYEHNGKIDIPELKEKTDLECERKRKGKEVTVRHPDYPSVLIEGLLFRANYLGSTQLHSEVKPSRDTRMIQAQEAVGRVKAPDSESQPSVAVDLFVSAEKILVLNTNLSEIMMDHNLKTISYIADIGDILVLMARRISPAHQNVSETSQLQNKILCHVFESDEAQLIAQSIGNAFQIAYIEYLKANGIDDPNIFKDVDYQDVLNDQEILTDELKMFSNNEEHKKVIVPKQKGECLGVVIVESGWGSMLPTVVLANMNPSGPAARCGLLNIGNQIISINDNSLVGLPLSTCQQIIKKCRNQTAVKLTVVSCPPVVEVHIRRPEAKYQLGFSVQNGVICSLLRGGIAERGGVRVGHHIIEINGVSVVAMSHEKIVNLLATAVGEIHLRTMPTSIFRLLTGQDTPHYI